MTMTEISSLADLTQISAKAVANHSFSNFIPLKSVGWTYQQWLALAASSLHP
jgi:hypothetical protein